MGIKRLSGRDLERERERERWREMECRVLASGSKRKSLCICNSMRVTSALHASSCHGHIRGAQNHGRGDIANAKPRTSMRLNCDIRQCSTSMKIGLPSGPFLCISLLGHSLLIVCPHVRSRNGRNIKLRQSTRPNDSQTEAEPTAKRQSNKPPPITKNISLTPSAAIYLLIE